MKTLLKIDVDSRGISECTCDIESSLICLMAKSEGFERLQDISDEDCFHEGIYASNSHEIGYGIPWVYEFANSKMAYYTPREAYAALIDRISCKGTWDSNPYVFVYEFELVD